MVDFVSVSGDFLYGFVGIHLPTTYIDTTGVLFPIVYTVVDIENDDN